MSLFKKKISYNELLLLISQIGYERYNILNNDLKKIFKYNETYFYLIWQIVNCFIFQRMLKFRNFISNDTDVFKDICNFIVNSIHSSYLDDINLAYIQIKNEILEIWKDDNDSNVNNEINRTAILGIFIGEKKEQNKGLGAETIKLLLDYGFNYLNLHEISLEVYEFNKRAIKCYEKVGFKECGRKRESKYLNGKYYDIITMDILKSEFKGNYIKNKNV